MSWQTLATAHAARIRELEARCAELERWQHRATGVLPLIPRDAGTALAREVSELLSTADNGTGAAMNKPDSADDQF